MTKPIQTDPITGLKKFNTRAAKASDNIAGKGYSVIDDVALKTLPEPPAGAGSRDRYRDQQPLFPCDGDHRLSEEWRHAGARGRDGQPCLHPYDPAL